MSRHLMSAAALALVVGAPATASAAPMNFFTNFVALNGSGVAGSARLVLDEATGTLDVTVRATGLEPGVRAMHIHGGGLMDATVPTPDLDTDMDGLIELGEGGVAYGGIIIPLDLGVPGNMGVLGGIEAGPDPMVESVYSRMFDLTDGSIFNDPFGLVDLLPLDRTEIVIHGMTLPADAGLAMGMQTGGICDGVNDDMDNCSVLIPVAAGTVQPVPLPAAGWALVAGIGALVGYGRLKRA